MWLAVALSAVVATAAPTAAVDPVALKRAADDAVALERYCEAMHWFVQLDGAAHDPKWVFNAAELARAGGDRARALSLYQQLVASDPGFFEVPAAKRAIGELQREIGKRGAGTACTPPPPRCGNGVREGEESCDDGNSATDDGCSAQCTRIPRCGDGIVDAAPDRSAEPSPATPSEQCDDGGVAAGDGCSPTCRIEACGNGVLDEGEACDDGNGQSGDGCRADCHKAERCGDSVVDVGEQCDDGNTVDGDGCSSRCTTAAASPARASTAARGGVPALVPWVIGGGGLVIVAAGVAGVVVGEVQRSDAERALAAHDEATGSFGTGPVDEHLASIDASASTHTAARQAVDGYDGFGRFATPSGLVAIAVGAAALLGGVVTLFLVEPDVEPADAQERAR